MDPLKKASAKWIKRSLPEEYEETPKIQRKVVTPTRDKSGLIFQPKSNGPDRERDEQHHRDSFANHFKYADPYTGNTRTYDEDGRYNCGRCNQAEEGKCLLIKIPSIDLKAGSCGDWENLCAGDSEQVLHEKSVAAAVYGVAKNGIGFGCHRCPYASKAFSVDSRGRSLYCGKGDFRVFSDACCALNGAPTLG